MRDSAPAGFHAPLSIESSHLRSIISHTRRLRYLTEHLHGILGDPAARHCVVANEVGQQLVVMADSPVWASRLRYQIPEIERWFSFHIREFNDCSVKIAVSPAQPAPAPALKTRPRPISGANAALIRATAESMADGKLKESLLRLARHSRV